MRLIRFLPILALAVSGNLEAVTIHEAIDQGDSAAVAAMLDTNPALLDDRLPNGRTPLHTAAYGGKLNIVALLLSRGANTDDTTNAGSLPLQGAALAGYTEVVGLLVEKGAKVNHTNQAGYSPLTNAAISGSVPTMKCLMDAGARLEPMTPEGQVPLICAIFSGSLEAVELLLRAGANPDCISPEGQGAVMAATLWAAWEPARAEVVHDILQRLLEHGADPNRTVPNGRTALMSAAMADDTTILRILLDGGANLDAVADNGATALTEAVEFGRLNSVKYLIARGARADGAEVGTGFTPLHFAVIGGEVPMVEAVLPATANPNMIDSTGMTPLDIAVRHGHTRISELLRKAGAETRTKRSGPISSAYLAQQPGDGEAYLWYLGNCGYLIKTRNHCLIFDYWTRGARPAEPSVANGFINPSELASEDVAVFVSHEHSDHYDSTIFGWVGRIPRLQYIFGFQPDSLQEQAQQGYSGQPYEYVGPGMNKTIDGMQVMAVRSNDAGVGFVITVDGLTIYHAGDLAGWRPNEREGFISQIDSIYIAVDSVDIALVNVTGCHHQDTVALAEGTVYTLEKLRPKLVIPTHGNMREYYYPQFMSKFKGQFPDLLTFCPFYRGDAARFTAGGKPSGIELL
ncbi:MAG: ankyrin repeat domain-containing protein [candidate division Zixibacteria bacterium]|nr:ankyrin repeat domain-containing protein [candidate division Zixibacteria bacterium]